MLKMLEKYTEEQRILNDEILHLKRHDPKVLEDLQKDIEQKKDA